MGRAARRADGALVVGLAPGEWYVLTDPGRPAAVAAELTAALADVDELVTVLDLTHGRALLRLTGADAPRTLAKVCAIDLADDMTPDGAVLRTSVAALVTDVVRDDRRGARSYLLGCEWSSARYLWETVLHAGAEYGIDVTGFGR
jgi:heterotetrameric sarcosine oxidase gamma subunit